MPLTRGAIEKPKEERAQGACPRLPRKPARYGTAMKSTVGPFRCEL